MGANMMLCTVFTVLVDLKIGRETILRKHGMISLWHVPNEPKKTLGTKMTSVPRRVNCSFRRLFVQAGLPGV